MSRKTVSLLIAVAFTFVTTPVFADDHHIDPIDPYYAAEPVSMDEVVVDEGSDLVTSALLFLATWSAPWIVVR